MTNNSFNFPNIDTSFWKLDDKKWVSERAEAWKKIEVMLEVSAHKGKKGLTIIKRYFLKGVLPDFKKLIYWQNAARHLDLFCFLWLHPSWDRSVLSELRDNYVNFPDVVQEDVEQGIGLFLRQGGMGASQNYQDENDLRIIHTDGHNELLFSVLLGDLTQETIPELGRNDWVYKKPKFDVTYLNHISKWLAFDNVGYLNQDCLYQYDCYLEHWYQCCPGVSDFYENHRNLRQLPYTKNGLFRIAQFDLDKEGDTCRSRFVMKIREILDNREFIPYITKMWVEAKAGTIDTINPWEHSLIKTVIV